MLICTFSFTVYLANNITTCYPRLSGLGAVTGVWLTHPGPAVYLIPVVLLFTEPFAWRQTAQRSQSFDVEQAVVLARFRWLYALQGGEFFAWTLTLDNKIVRIFVTRTKLDKPSSIFALNSDTLVVFFFYYKESVLSDARLKFEEDLYVHCVTGSMYRT